MTKEAERIKKEAEALRKKEYEMFFALCDLKGKENE